MPMYNLLEYNDSYTTTSGILWNYYIDEINDDANENVNNRIKNNNTVTGKSFKCNAKLVENTRNNNNILDAEVIVPLKYLSNFWKSLDLPLINCEIEIDLSRSKKV